MREAVDDEYMHDSDLPVEVGAKRKKGVK
jgi:hypothetical protein